jgi:hypothetical protein
MVIAALVFGAAVMVVLVNIEVWRRRTVSQLRIDDRRRAARERAWESVSALDRDY